MTKQYLRRAAVVDDMDTTATIPENRRASFVDTFNQQVIQGGHNDESVDGSGMDSDDESVTPGDDEQAHHADTQATDEATTAQSDDLQVVLRRWRISVHSILFVTTSAVVWGVWYVLRQQLAAVHMQTYTLVTNALHEALDDHVLQFRQAVTSLSWTISAANEAAPDDTFPLVRVPQFEVAARPVVQWATVTAWTPLVTFPTAWSDFAQKDHDWYTDSMATYQATSFLDDASDVTVAKTNQSQSLFRDTIWDGTGSSVGTEATAAPPLAPIWYCSPPPSQPWDVVNYNVLSDPVVAALVSTGTNPMGGTSAAQTAPHAVWSQFGTTTGPYSYHLEPVWARARDRTSPMVGFVTSIVAWDTVVAHIAGGHGLVAVVENSCDQALTFQMDDTVTFLGMGDRHDSSYDSTKVTIPLVMHANDPSTAVKGHCQYSMSLYSSKTFEASMETANLVPVCLSILVVAFAVLGCVFGLYDRFVRRRNLQVVTEAARSNAIISSLFPTQVRDRLFAEKTVVRPPPGSGPGGAVPTSKAKLKTMMNSGSYAEALTTDAQDLMYDSKPIADLFPETTILFADIAGFTAWSSVREPSQVFILLETLYRAFDDIAKRRRVFKVETIGDCYVAVTGLPDPRKDHAVAMARFSRDCMVRMRSLCKQLEVTLGPDTGDLAMRMGMHSGPVTAGVLRGERSRFQLFGDTMNTAARMEHTGLRDKIQVSQETADQLIAAGKTNWLSKREDVVIAKGKGEMHTYWLDIRSNASSVVDPTDSVGQHTAGTDGGDAAMTATLKFDSKTTRLIEWNVDVLLRSLKQIVARRKACPIDPSEYVPPNEARYSVKHGLNTLDEVMEVITLPKFKEAKDQDRPENVTFDDSVVNELREFVCHIAGLYRDNPFHNFEHASHVSMSVVKLLSRIIAPNQVESEELDVFLYHEDESDQNKKVASMLHDHTYGITSDPLTQFSCVLSALIHDVDHSGVPNAQLVEENANIAKLYKNKSVAEQNSVDLAWNLLMSDAFKTLRRTIYETDDELKRFRMLVVNSVMATDIVDKTLKTLRNLRWDRAFSQSTQSADNTVTVNRKATIVIEHLIQASDVAHTMQHWHVYRKWNERFFLECYQAYRDGRATKNPAEGWYEGEIGFFDFYIIPLAKKLKDCGVFGVSSDEYLNYAIRNRQEWETRGREVVNEMIEMVTEKEPTVDSQDF